MHIVFYTSDSLSQGGLSTALSWAIIVGGVYGAIHFAITIIGFLRRNLRFRPMGQLLEDDETDPH